MCAWCSDLLFGGSRLLADVFEIANGWWHSGNNRQSFAVHRLCITSCCAAWIRCVIGLSWNCIRWPCESWLLAHPPQSLKDTGTLYYANCLSQSVSKIQVMNLGSCITCLLLSFPTVWHFDVYTVGHDFALAQIQCSTMPVYTSTCVRHCPCTNSVLC